MMSVAFTELTGGAGCSIVSATPGPDLTAHGYRENEYAVHGIARSFAPSGASFAVVDTAAYTTRALVRRPIDTADFTGTVVVEWLNVSSGADAAPEYTYLSDELVRAGYVWVGISAQFTGIEGGHGSVGMALGSGPQSLAAKDPQRYGDLHHPGDAYCFDIFGTVCAALRQASDDSHPLGGLSVKHLLAVGESQSAMALTTYANHVVEVHDAIDGILIHSRAAGEMPFGDPGCGVDIATVFDADPATIRESLRIPVLIVQTETDVLTNFRFVRSRQPDTDRLRLWEIAGTAHADLHQIGPYEDLLGCPTPVNRGQQRFVLRAALSHLTRWAGGGTPPPSAPPLCVDDATDTFELDEIGNVRGGVRTPCVDVPTQVLSGIVSGELPRICLLFGSTTPADPDLLARRYRDTDDYLAQYRAATTEVIDAGFALEADREEILADARPDLVPAPTSNPSSPQSTVR
ncbi:alpha/beta hydrolase domain-containing protein [Gordonia sp. PKS22-38]|uniref:Alpha/beta hydrolase domain-containing protein n=1 Tax=Gordonia prachuapensis TaxID=3115651 RepID=A0ABU7MMA5_9ACTN|nr:alpha/beta hydrolase domain-containing protein [Gordonia sp. PKS22-38]